MVMLFGLTKARNYYKTMELKHLRSFVLVAETASFSVVAFH